MSFSRLPAAFKFILLNPQRDVTTVPQYDSSAVVYPIERSLVVDFNDRAALVPKSDTTVAVPAEYRTAIA